MHDVLVTISAELGRTFVIAQYLNDMWIFDTQEYKWRHIEFKESERKPSYVYSQFPAAMQLKAAWLVLAAASPFCPHQTVLFYTVRSFRHVFLR